MSAANTWAGMMRRCYDPDDPKYPSYGGRGIRVCDRWICRRLFIQDMGEPAIGMTLNRIDNDGPYSPDNCEWADYFTQSQNRRDNRRLTFNGRTECLTEWARVAGINRTTFRKRIDAGWDIEDAITKPLDKNRINSGRRRR